MSYSREKAVAQAAVVEAAKLCGLVREDMVQGALQKEDRSPVTVADFGSQALVCRRLREAFPDDPIVAEEDAGELRKPEHAGMLDRVAGFVAPFHPGVRPGLLCDWIDQGNGGVGGRYWTLDPIDGTKGFLRNDQYAVALALVEDGRVRVGALACPALVLCMDRPDAETGCLFLAVRGEGVTLAPLTGGESRQVEVARTRTQKNWRFVESVEADHGDQERQRAVADAAGIREASLRMDSQAKYGAVARGDAVLYLRLPSPKYPDYREKVWDHAAGSLVVEEAGGRVTDLYGRALDFGSDSRMHENRGVVVSNGAIHGAVIEALAR